MKISKTSFISIKSWIIFSLFFFIINYFGIKEMSVFAVVKALVVSVLCGAVLSLVSGLLRRNFLKENNKILKDNKNSMKNRKK